MSYKSEDDRRIERSIIAGHKAFFALKYDMATTVNRHACPDCGAEHEVKA